MIKFNFIALSDQKDTYVHKIKLSVMRGIVGSSFRKKIVLIFFFFWNLSIFGEKLWAVWAYRRTCLFISNNWLLQIEWRHVNGVIVILVFSISEQSEKQRKWTLSLSLSISFFLCATWHAQRHVTCMWQVALHPQCPMNSGSIFNKGRFLSCSFICLVTVNWPVIWPLNPELWFLSGSWSL